MHVLKQVTTIEIFWPVTLKHVHWYNPNMGTPNKQIDTWKFIKHYAQRNNDRQWSTQWDHHCRTPHNTESVAIAEIVKLQRPPKKKRYINRQIGSNWDVNVTPPPDQSDHLTIWLYPHWMRFSLPPSMRFLSGLWSLFRHYQMRCPICCREFWMYIHIHIYMYVHTLYA